MPHAIWKGDISFGLVYIPVTLYSAEAAASRIKLVMLDKRDLSPIGYKKINKNTGQPVPEDQIVMGYEYEKKSYIIVTREELEKARPEATQSIEIIEFVDSTEIPPEYFEKPYYLEPTKKGKHSYVLLREILAKTKKAGIAKVVIHTRQYLAALLAEEKVIMLQLMRFPNEILDQSHLELPAKGLAANDIEKKEITIAEELVKSMSSKWNPKKYKEDYQQDLLTYITEKIKLGGHAKKHAKETKHAEKKGQVIDIMSLLKKSIAQSKKHVSHKSPKRKTQSR
jgi:DNA end-binding protein Ku